VAKADLLRGQDVREDRSAGLRRNQIRDARLLQLAQVRRVPRRQNRVGDCAQRQAVEEKARAPANHQVGRRPRERARTVQGHYTGARYQFCQPERLIEPTVTGVATIAMHIEGFEPNKSPLGWVYYRQCWLCREHNR